MISTSQNLINHKAILLNRIQNIVVPPRHPIARRRSTSRLQRIYNTILPLDLSSTYCRLVLRLPSLYFLSKALILWTVILFQTAELFPSWSWMSGLGTWAAEMEMEAVCWFSFCSVCLALCTGALTRGLEGVGASANSSPFNLVNAKLFSFRLWNVELISLYLVWIRIYASYLFLANHARYPTARHGFQA